MSKYITLSSTVTPHTLSLAKSLITPAKVCPPITAYTTHHSKLSASPHISVLVHALKTGSPLTMLPYLVGRKIVVRGTHFSSIKIGATAIPTGSVIISTTSTGLITYSKYAYTGGYAHYPLKVSVSTSTTTLTGLIKMLKSGLYTIL